MFFFFSINLFSLVVMRKRVDKEAGVRVTITKSGRYQLAGQGNVGAAGWSIGSVGKCWCSRIFN